MTKYILARFVLLIPVLIGVSVVTFSLIRLVPGDPVTVILGPDARVRPEDMAAIRAKYGLDDPAPIQYARWMGHVLTGDLGTACCPRCWSACWRRSNATRSPTTSPRSPR